MQSYVTTAVSHSLWGKMFDKKKDANV